MGYGEKGIPGMIPKNAVLYFDIEVVDWTLEPPVPVKPTIIEKTPQIICTETATEALDPLKDEDSDPEGPDLDRFTPGFSDKWNERIENNKKEEAK